MCEHFDAIVIGVGGMGSAAVYELAKRGKKVLGIEQFDIPHAMGSSHGLTRIIRLAYAESPAYVPLLRRSYELWNETQNKAGEPLLIVTGSIDASRPDANLFSGSIASCQEHNLPHEIYTAKQLKKRFPAVELADDMMANYQPDGGFVLSERAIVAHVNLAMSMGAEIHGREKVLDWEPIGGGGGDGGQDGVKVTTEQGVYTADKLVITAGAWANKLIEPLKDGLAVPERQVLTWMQPKKPELFGLGTLPVWVIEDDEGVYYGFPTYGIPGFKFGRMNHLEQTIDPDNMDREAHAEDDKLLRDFAEQYFPQACGPTLSLRACIFTNTPDKTFIVDKHPDHPQVVFGAGFSGHGFKFVSVMGEIFAELAIDGETRHDIDLFRLNRFN